MMKADEDCLVSVETLMEKINNNPEVEEAEPNYIYGDIAEGRRRVLS